MSNVSMVGNDFAMSEGIWTCGKDGILNNIDKLLQTMDLDYLINTYNNKCISFNK